MAIQVVDRLLGSAGGSVTITLPSYQAGDLVIMVGVDGEGTLIFAQTVSQQGWSLIRHNRFTTASLFIMWKYMDGTEGTSVVTSGTTLSTIAPKRYIKVTLRGADRYRGFALVDALDGDVFSGSWPEVISIDPAELIHPFISGEELFWVALAGADANPDPAGIYSGGPSGVDFSHASYYEPTNQTPSQPRACNFAYADKISSDLSWDPEAWTHPNSNEQCAWTLAFPPAREHSHPDVVKVERMKSGSMSSPQTVSVTVPDASNALLVFYVIGGNGTSLSLDPSGLNITPTLGASSVDATATAGTAQMFYCEAPPAGIYDLRLTKSGTSNNARVVIVFTIDNVDEVVDFAAAVGTAVDFSLNLDTESDCLALAGISIDDYNSSETAFPGQSAQAFIDGVPMAAYMDHMTLTGDVNPATTSVGVRAFAGRTDGGTQQFRAHRLHGSSNVRRLLVMYVRGRRGDDNPIWASTDF